MSRFADFVDSLERLHRLARVMGARIGAFGEGRPMSPVLRSAVESAADDVAAYVRMVTPFERPRDMIAEEWAEPSIYSLRAAVQTLGLVSDQRPIDLRDWTRDAELALESFLEAKLRFELEVER